MSRSTVVVAGVVVVVLGLFVVRRTTSIFSGGGRADVDVQVSMQNGVCVARDPLPGGGAWLHAVRWHITNVDCEAPQYVALQVYRPRLDGGGYGVPERIINPDPASSGPVARGAPAVTVPGRVRKFHIAFSDAVYKYQICVGTAPNPTTNCFDPDFDVWPF